MSENYIVINGKKAELTEEQLKALGVEVETERKNPFKRVNKGERFFSTCGLLKVLDWVDLDTVDDRLQYNNANYFTDKDFAEQVALHQLLYRKLLKYTYDNECEDIEEWDGSNGHWTIRYNDNLDRFFAYRQERYKASDVYFSSEEGAERAIYEVVEPFVREHPEFVW